MPNFKAGPTSAAMQRSSSTLQMVDKLGSILADADSVLALMVRSYGGEIAPMDRGTDVQVAHCIEYLHTLVQHAQAIAIEQPSTDLAPQAATEIRFAHGIAACLNATVWAAGNELSWSDDTLCSMFAAMERCLRRAMAWLDPDVEDHFDLFLLEEDRPRQAVKVSAEEVGPQPRARRRDEKTAVAA